MKIQPMTRFMRKSWVYTKLLSYLFRLSLDDTMSRSKDEFTGRALPRFG